MLRKRRQTVGLYIGQRTIAMAHVRVAASGAMTIDRLATSDTPADAVDGAGISDVDAVSRAIRDLLAANSVKTKHAALAISTDSIVARLLTLPQMPRNEMLTVLKGEVENYAVLTGEEPVLDFQIVDRKAEGIGQKLETLVVALSEPLLNSYVAAVESATSLRLATVEAIPTAILRALTSGQQDQTILVSIEESNGVIVGVSNGTIQFIHSIEIGRERLAEDEGFFEELLAELNSSLDYCNTKFRAEAAIREIALFMDGANSSYICEKLEERLDVSVVCPELEKAADEHIEAQTIDYGLSAYAAIGAASRVKTSDSDGNINLLSPQGATIIGLRKRVSVVFVCMIAMALLSICASSLLEVMSRSTMERALSIQQNGGMSDLQILREVADIEAEAARLVDQINVTNAIMDSVRYVDWGELLQEIGAMVPENTWLSEFSWEDNNNNNLSFSGSALSYDPVFEFRDTLTNSPYFDSAKLVSAKKSETKGRLFVEFEMLCEMGQETTKTRQRDKRFVSMGL